MESKLKEFHFDEVRDMLFACGVETFSVMGSSAIYMFLDDPTGWQPNDIDISVSSFWCAKKKFRSVFVQMCQDKKWVVAPITEISVNVITPTMKFQIIDKCILDSISVYDISICRIARVFRASKNLPYYISEGEAMHDILHKQFHVGEEYMHPYEPHFAATPEEHTRTRERIAKYEKRGFVAIGTSDPSYATSRDFTAPAYDDHAPQSAGEPKKRKIGEID